MADKWASIVYDRKTGVILGIYDKREDAEEVQKQETIKDIDAVIKIKEKQITEISYINTTERKHCKGNIKRERLAHERYEAQNLSHEIDMLKRSLKDVANNKGAGFMLGTDYVGRFMVYTVEKNKIDKMYLPQ